MTADPQPGTFQLAVVRGGKPDWAAAEVVIAAPAADPAVVPSIAALFAMLIDAPGAPAFDGVQTASMDRDRPGVVLTVDSRTAFLAWAGFLGLAERSEVFDRTPRRLHLVRSGRVTVAGVRLAAAVRWRLDVTEVGR